MTRSQKLKMLVDLNVAAFRGQLGPDARLATDEVLLVALHKSRVEIVHLPDVVRLESVEWLRSSNMLRLNGLPLPSPGELPV